MNTIQLSQKRTEEILLSLDRLGFLSRSQIQELHDLKSDRNACRVLKSMEQYLNKIRLEENVFYLNKLGREMINSDKVMNKSMQIKHVLMRNQLYIYFGCPENWLPEREVVLNGSPFLRSDVLFKTDVWHFTEIDHIQKMIVNEKKIKKYAELKETGGVQKNFKYFPRLVFLTTSEDRKRKLIGMCREHNLGHVVFTMNDIK